MASIAKLPSRRYWYALYRDATSRQHCVSTKLEHTPDAATPKARGVKAAENRRLATELAARLEEAERGNATEAHLRKLLSDISSRINKRKLEFARTRSYLTEWAQRAFKVKSSRTAESYQRVMDDFIESLGAKAEAALVDIAPKDIQGFMDHEAAAGKGASTLRIITKVLNIPFHLALRQGLILQNPVASVELPQAANEHRKPFTPGQIKSLLAHADGEWKTAILLAASTGARLSDAVSMRFSNVDLQRRLITFRPSKTARKKSDLIIPLPAALETHLLEMPTSDDPQAFLTPTLAGQQTPGRSGLSCRFQEIMRKAGIEQDTVEATAKGGRKFNRYGFHSLRHSFVSMLANAGVGPEIRKKLSGHADDDVHARYTHHELETLRKAMNTLPSFD